MKKCRYNSKHKFASDDALFKHEENCPDKEKKNMIVCPFTQKHIIPKRQYESHIKNCNYKPKKPKNKNIKDNNENFKDIENNKIKQNNIQNSNNNNENNKNDTDYSVEDENKNEDINKIKIFDFDDNDNNGDVFDEDDFIFKQCYI